MQDLRSTANGGGGGGIGGRIFGSERRLRPFPKQPLKCPRCDSLNTKFCYYNNYNLSQPRHFCKGCRRYWTKGGVLRNVPVGGGCRKTKRSKPKPTSNDDLVEKDIKKTTTSNSSSDSSSLTATTTEAASSTTPAAAAAAAAAAAMLNFTTDSSGLVVSKATTQTTTTPPNPNFSFEHASMMQLNNLDHQDNGIFSKSGSFTSLMNASSNPGYLGYNLSDLSPFGLHHQQQQQEIQLEEQKMTTTSLVDELKGFYDQTGIPEEMPGLPNTSTTTGNGELTGLDWQRLFDLPGTVVDQTYWNQSSQWANNDHPFYLP